MMIETIWLIIGFLGQAMFAGRFLVQWLVSEMKKESVVPIYFWYLSLGGGAALFAYATYKLDPVFMVGQASGLVVYARNLMLVRKGKKNNQVG
jgi:lipid-A-disaccharide synthase-like uncharacterized protein